MVRATRKIRSCARADRFIRRTAISSVRSPLSSNAHERAQLRRRNLRNYRTRVLAELRESVSTRSRICALVCASALLRSSLYGTAGTSI